MSIIRTVSERVDRLAAALELGLCGGVVASGTDEALVGASEHLTAAVDRVEIASGVVGGGEVPGLAPRDLFQLAVDDVVGVVAGLGGIA